MLLAMLDNNGWCLRCTSRSTKSEADTIPERKTLHEYRRACEVLIAVNVSVLKKVALPFITGSPMVTRPMVATANVTGIGAFPLISTCQVSTGMRTNLSGPVTLQLIVKLSPAVGIPGKGISRSKSPPWSSTISKQHCCHKECINTTTNHECDSWNSLILITKFLNTIHSSHKWILSKNFFLALNLLTDASIWL